MKKVRNTRLHVEQHLIPAALYSDGPMLLYRLMGDATAEIRKFYSQAGIENLDLFVQENHRVYYREDTSVLVIRIGMPDPEDVLQSRAVYLCYCSKNGDNLYFSSELAEEGNYLLCCKPDSKIFHMICGDAPDDTQKEFDMVADCYWELMINDGLKELESVCSSRR